MTRESAQKHAALIRAFAAGHEIEWLHPSNSEWCLTKEPLFEAHYDYRIALPPNKSYHNPDNITEEQLGKNHRFCLLEEYDGRIKEYGEYFAKNAWYPVNDATVQSNTYRVPIETLFPLEPPTLKTRPFTVDDITPNMVFRMKKHTHGFNVILSVNMDFVSLQKDNVGFERLSKDYLYSTDGKAFHPCSVEI